MKAQELIKILNKLIETHGDLPIELDFENGDHNNARELQEVSFTGYNELSDKKGKVCITLHDWKQ